jgi:hypothetical protein
MQEKFWRLLIWYLIMLDPGPEVHYYIFLSFSEAAFITLAWRLLCPIVPNLQPLQTLA